MDLSSAGDLFKMWSKIQRACLLREQAEPLVQRLIVNCPMQIPCLVLSCAVLHLRWWLVASGWESNFLLGHPAKILASSLPMSWASESPPQPPLPKVPQVPGVLWQEAAAGLPEEHGALSSIYLKKRWREEKPE